MLTVFHAAWQRVQRDLNNRRSRDGECPASCYGQPSIQVTYFLPADQTLFRTRKTNNTNILFYTADLFINALLYMHIESMHAAFPLHCNEMHFTFRCTSNCLMYDYCWIMHVIYNNFCYLLNIIVYHRQLFIYND